jgi:uncharacterized tellurite resistance protein B-like protein
MKFVDSIRSLLRPAPSNEARQNAPSDAPNPVHVAACALLLDIAYADGEFAPAERAHLESVLARQFGLDAAAGQRVIELAETERKLAIDYYQFTSVLQREYDLGQKMVLAEIMWGLVLADGTIADREQYLTRKIANLLDLEPGYLSQAKSVAAQRRQ